MHPGNKPAALLRRSSSTWLHVREMRSVESQASSLLLFGKLRREMYASVRRTSSNKSRVRPPAAVERLHCEFGRLHVGE